MSDVLVLASGSPVRRALLENAAVPLETTVARVDEEGLRAGMVADGVPPRDIADQLGEAKARKVSGRMPERLVLGCDQILEHRGEVLSKPGDAAGVRAQLERLRGEAHALWSSAVLCRDGRPLWRHIGEARMHMTRFSDAYLDGYVERNAAAVAGSVGGYQLEAEGVRLFSRVEGDYFTVLGLPLLPLLSQLARLKVIAS